MSTYTALCVSFFSLFSVGYCYANLSRVSGASASQSSTFKNASLAVDGNYAQSFPECAHTGKHQTLAWIQVDLGTAYSLKSVRIYSRNEDSWPPYRLRQFYLDVSNSSVDTSIKRSRVRCYTDNNTSPATPPPVIDIPCKQTARYVIVETTYHAPEDKDSIGPVLEICEIEVIGCNIRHFGENCALCNACSVCDVINGNCTALCSPYCVAKQCDTHGYCTLGCTEGYWGNKCQNFCPSFCHLKICNRVDGICNSCIDGYYGDRCEQLCNSKCSGQKCNKDTGFCTTGCVSGYYGSYCQDRCGNCGTGICSRNTGNCETCNKGVYGSQCDKKCSNNCLNKECRPIDGHCSNGCISGFYGSLCNMQCSENCVQTICSRNGVCINGCKPNWTGDKCAECSRTHHGPRCDQQCSPVCLNGTCFSDNGSCIEGCNINFIENFKVQQQRGISSHSDVYSVLYAVITILVISATLNIFLIVRNIRRTDNGRQNSDNFKRQQDLSEPANTAKIVGEEDNAGYQELGQLSQPSHYDELK